MLKSKNENDLNKMIDGFKSYLNCPCAYFAPAQTDKAVMTAFRKAKERGKSEGFFPVLVAVDDTLAECLAFNTDSDSEGFLPNVDPKKTEAYRKETLSAELPSGKAFLDKMFGVYKEDTEEAGEDFVDRIGAVEGGEVNDRFSGYWDYFTKKTCPLLLAEIPVKNPWEIFAYLPFGAWNECPDTKEQMAVAKYWYELYGAVPAVLTHDVLEYELPRPVGKEKAMELAKEQYGFCVDIVEQGVETIGALADMLSKSTVWYFWWD